MLPINIALALELSLLLNSFLLDEKRQDSGTVALNIKVMLTNLVVRGDILLSTFEELISIVDVCSGQYRSGSVCHQLCNIAKAFNIVYDCIIHPPVIENVLLTLRMGSTRLCLIFSSIALCITQKNWKWE